MEVTSPALIEKVRSTTTDGSGRYLVSALPVGTYNVKFTLQGFTTVTLMGTLMVGGLLVAATFTAVQPDIAFTKKDEDSNQAYGAAESGLHRARSAIA